MMTDGDTPTPATPDGSAMPRRRLILRVLWVSVALLCIGAFLASLPARRDELLRSAGALQPDLTHLGISAGFHVAYNLALETTVALVFFAVAAFIAWRKRDDAAALAIALMLIAFGAALPGTIYALVTQQPIWHLSSGFLLALGWLAALLFLCVFPDGAFVPGWTRPLAALAAVWTALFFAFVGPLSESRRWLLVLSFLVWAALFAAGALAQFQRYTQVSGVEQRQQTKWVVFGSMAALGGTCLAVAYHVATLALTPAATTDVLFRFVAAALLSLAALLIPLSVAVAMLRHRLYDVDVLINRTLVYGTLTGLLALIYFAAVVVFAQSLRTFTQQGSDVAIALSTVLIAALFQPLRRRVQSGIDRRFYRGKYDAARALEAFSAALPFLVNQDELRQRLTAVVEETMRPNLVTVWLQSPATKAPPTIDEASGPLASNDITEAP